MKDLRITPPEGYEIDKNKSTLSHIVFKKTIEIKESYLIDPVDGNKYRTVKIGNQWWMAENLRYIKEFPLIVKDEEWKALSEKSKAVSVYDNNLNNLLKYGALYTWEAAKCACPKGWHLPSDEEWKELEKFISNDGYNDQKGIALKATIGWNEDGNGTNIYGFSALPGGSRRYNGTFGTAGCYGYWWSATEGGSDDAYGRYLCYYLSDVNRNYNFKSNGFSVRCIKDK